VSEIFKRILEQAKRLPNDQERRERADDLRRIIPELELDERDECMRVADEIDAMCTTPDNKPAEGQYVPRAATLGEISKVYGSDMLLDIKELCNELITPLFETSNKELPDKQRDYALKVLNALFVEFSGHGEKKKVDRYTKELISKFHEWIGDEQDDDIILNDRDDYKEDIENARSAIADYLLILINSATPVPRGVDPGNVVSTDNRSISGAQHDYHDPNRGSDGGERMQFCRSRWGGRRAALDRNPKSFGKASELDYVKKSRARLLSEDEKDERLRRLLARAAKYTPPQPTIPEHIGAGFVKIEPKRKYKRPRMKYERDAAAAKVRKALEWHKRGITVREALEQYKQAVEDKLNAALGRDRFKSMRRSLEDWRASAHDDELPEEKIEAMLMSDKEQFYATRSYKKRAVTKKEIDWQEAVRRAAAEEAEFNKSDPAIKPLDWDVEGDPGVGEVDDDEAYNQE